MKIKFIIKKLFVYSEENKKYFYTEFNEGVNIIYGKNTAGKSTIFQTIFYTLGINDNNEYLKEILDENLLFRLDCEIYEDDRSENVIFIREDETIFIKRGENPVIRFNGINSNVSVEHIKLKQYISEMFNFSLKLESKNEYKAAPIETIFLPYYVSQSVGWVYLRKSFSNLEFYKNFKEDYLDYYIGIETCVDREKKKELQKRLKNIEEEITFYSKLEKNNDEFTLTKLEDEEFVEESEKYIGLYKENLDDLKKKEEEYISKCNEQSYYQKRQALLKKISRNHKSQNPIGGRCPVCDQSLNFSIEASYKYFQEENDTELEMTMCKEKIKKTQSEINKLHKDIQTYKEKIVSEYNILSKYFSKNTSFNTWLKNKTNIKLVNNIKLKVGELESDKMDIVEELKIFKTEEEVKISRKEKEKIFSSIFLGFVKGLGVKAFKEDRYRSLYKISAFPSQGVELHKTVLAYNFAFNKLISKIEGIHRIPFMLDAIFKEDIEQENKNLIIKFISENRPIDTQLIMSIAEIKEKEERIDIYNMNYFNGKANLICIGGGIKERAFLKAYDKSIDEILNETLDII